MGHPCATGGAGSEEVSEKCRTKRGKQNKSNKMEEKKVLVQHLLSQTTLYFSLCIVFLKDNHIIHEEIM